MADVILYLGISTCGYILGMLLRKTNMKTAWLATAETLAVFVLIFTMGLRVGCNREVIESFGTIGLYAVIFTLVIMTCSALAVFFFRQIAGFDRYGVPARGRKEKAPKQLRTAKPGTEAF
ncbi:MAG: LysO family transporter, partial [Firmicutes bacterium]|nr:LysO family transporter [Bacillota bacterium]